MKQLSLLASLLGLVFVMGCAEPAAPPAPAPAPAVEEKMDGDAPAVEVEEETVEVEAEPAGDE